MSTTFEPALLPDNEKLELCEGLLREFGVTRIARKTRTGEMIHSCPIPGAHRNGDRNPSASLNYKKLTFNCLGCGSRGGLLWFIATCRGEDAQGVRDWLSSATGTGGHVMELGRFMEILDALEAPDAPPPPIPVFSRRLLEPWTDWGMYHPYLTEVRGCHEETLAEFEVGYAPEYSRSPSVPTQERIIIPIFWRGELVGWQARRLDEDDEPKYLNSVEFPRDRVIYNYHDFLSAVVVESPLSVLRRHHHVPTMLSTLGAEVTEVQQRLLHRYSKIILWYDNDDAGWRATEEVGAALESFCEVWAVENPWTADPAELPDSTAEEVISNAVPFSVWERPKRLVEWSA